MQKRYPKVLILGLTFSDTTGSGITISNLFRDWPKENFAVATLNKTNIEPDACKNSYFIGADDRNILFPFNLFIKIPKSKITTNQTSVDKIQTKKKTTPNMELFIKKSYFSIIELVGLRPIYYRTKVSKNFIQWINKFNPEIIFTHAGSLELIRLSKDISKRTNTKVAVHINDDYLSTLGRRNIFSFYWKKVINKEFKDLINRNSILMSICKKMSDEYKMRYGKDFIPFHNPVDIDKWIKDSKSDWKVKGTFVILYAGRIGTGTSNSIIDVARAVQSLNEKGYNIIFEIQTRFVEHPVIKILQNIRCVKITHYIKYENLPKKFSKADLLVLPMDFDKRNFRYIKYSMPTKTSEYMASGTPVLVYAPGEAALAHYACEGKWGHAITQRDVEELEKAISRLYESESERKRLGARAKELAQQYHDANRVREEFRKVMACEI